MVRAKPKRKARPIKAKPSKAKPAKKKKRAPSKAAPAPKKKKPATKKKPAPRKRKQAPEPRAQRSRVPTARRALVKALEYAHDLARAERSDDRITLAIRAAPPRSPRATQQPGTSSTSGYLWEVIGQFKLGVPVTYLEAGLVVARWAGRLENEREAAKLARLISPGVTDEANERIARIVVTYQRGDGVKGDYTLGESTPWGYCVARAYDKLYVSNETRRGNQRDGLVQAYAKPSTQRGAAQAPTRVVALYISLSSQFGTGTTVAIP